MHVLSSERWEILQLFIHGDNYFGGDDEAWFVPYQDANLTVESLWTMNNSLPVEMSLYPNKHSFFLLIREHMF
jgi:hypothetical protein